MAIIRHSDLFEFDLWDKAIKEAEKGVDSLGKSVDNVFGRLSSQQKELNATLRQYEQLLKAFNITSNGAADGLRKLNDEVDEAIKRKRDNAASEQGLKVAIDATKASVSEIRAEYNRLKKEFESLKPDQADYAQQVQTIKTRLTEVVPRLGEFTTAVKKTKQDVDAAEGSYRKMSNELGELRNKLRSMPNAFDPITGAINKNNKEATAMIERINTLDKTLKAADAAMGNYQRNVGNYASGFNGLRNSINQLSREAPAFANSLQTGFLAISNNLPTLVDEIDRLKKANVGLVASGEKPVSIFKQLGAAFFSWQTLISAGITLLTVYGKDLVEWVGSLFKAKESVDSLKVSQEQLNKAFGSTEYTNAVKAIEELKINVDLAKKGLIDKTEVLYQYNEGLGKTMGSVKTLDELEQKLVNNGPAYVKMMLYKAAAQATLDKAAKDAADTQIKIADLQAKAAGIKNTDYTGYARAFDVPQKERDKINNNANQLARDLAANNKKLLGIAESFQKQAAEIANDPKNGFDLLGLKDKQGKAESKSAKDAERAAEKRLKAFEDSIRKQQALVEKAAELQIKTEELRYAKGEISELEFQKKRLDIIRRSIEAQIALEKQLGKRADGSKIAGFKEKEVQAEIDFTKFVERQQEERRKLAAKSTQDVVKEKAEAKKKEEELEEAQGKRFEEIQNRRLQQAVDAENRRFNLLKAGRNVSFMEEIAHLERLKELRKRNAEDTTEIEFEIERRNADRKKQLHEETQAFLFQVATTGLQILQQQSQADSESRINALQNEKQRELALAGNNAQAREKIEADYQQRIAAEKTKQAKKEKEFALYNVAINTAASVAKTIAEWGMPLAIPFIALAVGTGLLQAALIASRPIPKFEKGTKSAPKGPAIVNEAGFELIERNGRMYVAKGRGPTLVDLQGGEKIWTHEESKRILGQSLKAQEQARLLNANAGADGISKQVQDGRQAESIAILAKALQANNNGAALEKAFEKAVKGIPVTEIHHDERGMIKRQREINQRTTYLNNRYTH